MVRTFERPATIGLPEGEIAEGAALEGLFIPASEMPECGGALIAAPHPQMGGSMDSPVVTELALACEQAGLASLRFNWRGVGASAGVPSGEARHADADYSAGLSFLRDTVHGPILAAGYSFGALTAVRAAGQHPALKRLLLVAPPPDMLDRDALHSFRGPVLILTGDRDRFVDVDAWGELVAERANAQLEVIKGADHFFMEELGQLRRRVDAWFAGGD